MHVEAVWLAWSYYFLLQKAYQSYWEKKWRLRYVKGTGATIRNVLFHVVLSFL